MKSIAPKFSKAEVSRIANVLQVIANERRLVLFAEMIRSGETTVTSLAESAGLSLSAASQHLGKMRKAGFISFRRDSQTLWYRISDARVSELIETLDMLFCQDCKRS
jgi:DNA-binding transcriptional ArsR family regulator